MLVITTSNCIRAKMTDTSDINDISDTNATNDTTATSATSATNFPIGAAHIEMLHIFELPGF